ncbi:hypothetical protein FRC18_004541 [Serendipita sp. 400]|nr:hypothetical protein FRC18_004541 [Serendipita sp. 400]
MILRGVRDDEGIDVGSKLLPLTASANPCPDHNIRTTQTRRNPQLYHLYISELVSGAFEQP